MDKCEDSEIGAWWNVWSGCRCGREIFSIIFHDLVPVLQVSMTQDIIFIAYPV